MTKVAEFEGVTRVTVVGKNGVVYEDYNALKGGAEIHIQDEGRTLKIMPQTHLPVLAQHVKPKWSPWRLPLGVMIALILIVLAGTVIALVACAPGIDRGTTTGTDSGTVRQGTSTQGFTEQKITLSGGGTVTCLTWSVYDYINETTSSGIDCNWDRTEPGQ